MENIPRFLPMGSGSRSKVDQHLGLCSQPGPVSFGLGGRISRRGEWDSGVEFPRGCGVCSRTQGHDQRIHDVFLLPQLVERGHPPFQLVDPLAEPLTAVTAGRGEWSHILVGSLGVFWGGINTAVASNRVGTGEGLGLLWYKKIGGDSRDSAGEDLHTRAPQREPTAESRYTQLVR